jgi:vesicle-fusing ATPase
MLGVTEPKIVNGPEIFNKYVGQSEENMRNLFADAMNCKDPNKLHVVIFDEIDCIAGRRTDNDGTGSKASNNVVNQLLSLMDGVKGPKNLLVIGMTNRRDLIDSAMLRPGRFEVQIPFGLPDEKGRLAIFEVHTKKMRSINMLDKDVDLDSLAQTTVNFTGAEIAGLIRSAQSFAMMEQVRLKQASGTDVDAKRNTKLLVGQRHFDQAFDEVPPALGVAREKWENYQRGGILVFDKTADPKELVEWCDLQIHSPSRSLLIQGGHGCGNTATAAFIAQNVKSYGCIRWLSPQKVLHLREAEKASILRDNFEQAFACDKSLIIIDDLEGWISYVSPARFSSVLFEQLMNLCRQTPPSGRSCTLVCTTHQYDFFMNSGWEGLFLKEHALPTVNSDNVKMLCKHYSLEDLDTLSLPAPIKTVVHLLGLPSSFASSHSANPIPPFVKISRTPTKPLP